MANQISEYEKMRLKNVEDNKRILEELMGDLKALPYFGPKQATHLRQRVFKRRSVESPGIIRRNPLRSTRSTYGSSKVRSKTRRHSVASLSSSSSSSTNSSDRLCVRFGFFQKRMSQSDDCTSDSNSDEDEEEWEYPEPKVKHVKRTTVDERRADEITEEDLAMVAQSVMDKKYDSIYGTSCHQCRQKTNDMKTICRSGHCWGVRGQFCGPCLRNRYGEDAKEALKDDLWSCPPCRGVCNCSLCRKRKGKSCTGILIHTAREQGYNSVLDYLNGLNQVQKQRQKEFPGEEKKMDHSTSIAVNDNDVSKTDQIIISSVEVIQNETRMKNREESSAEMNKTENGKHQENTSNIDNKGKIRGDQKETTVTNKVEKARENQNETQITDKKEKSKEEQNKEASVMKLEKAYLNNNFQEMSSIKSSSQNEGENSFCASLEKTINIKAKETNYHNIERKSGLAESETLSLDKVLIPSESTKVELHMLSNMNKDRRKTCTTVENCKVSGENALETEKRSRKRKTMDPDFIDFTKCKQRNTKKKLSLQSDKGKEFDKSFSAEPTVDTAGNTTRNKSLCAESTIQTTGNKSLCAESTIQTTGNKSLCAESTIQTTGNKSLCAESTIQTTGNNKSNRRKTCTTVENCKVNGENALETEKRSRKRKTMDPDFIDFTKCKQRNTKKKLSLQSDKGKEFDKSFSAEPTVDTAGNTTRNKSLCAESTIQTTGNKSLCAESTIQTTGNKSLCAESTIQTTGNKSLCAESTIQTTGNKSLCAESTIQTTGNNKSMKRKHESFDSEELKQLEIPYKHGWWREVVIRNVCSTSCNKADVYYHPPQGRKLRSKLEVVKHLVMTNSELKLENFSFLRKAILHPPFEVVRSANHIKICAQNASSPQHLAKKVKKGKFEIASDRNASLEAMKTDKGQPKKDIH